MTDDQSICTCASLPWCKWALPSLYLLLAEVPSALVIVTAGCWRWPKCCMATFMEFMIPPAAAAPVTVVVAATFEPVPADDDAAAAAADGAPPDTEYVLLVALLSADEGSNRCLSLCLFASDLARGRNTSNIVGRRFGEAIPCTVDWLSTGESSPLRRRSNEPERDPPLPTMRSVLLEIFSLCRFSFSSLAASRSMRRAVSRSSLRASFSRRDCSFSCRLERGLSRRLV